MEVKTSYQYDFNKSIARIDDILQESGEYEYKQDIPSRDSLNYSDGYYVPIYALFVDIRDSSSLPQKHTKSVLAKIYRSYISELVAIMQSFETCKEINIVGDCVSGIFRGKNKSDVISPFFSAGTINSLINILNYKLKGNGYSAIQVGIGIAKGQALMIQTGYKGSGLNEVVWMGNVVNQASNLCGIANKGGNNVIVISKDVYDDLKGYKGGRSGNIEYQSCFTKISEDAYTGNIIRIDMDDWLNNQK